MNDSSLVGACRMELSDAMAEVPALLYSELHVLLMECATIIDSVEELNMFVPFNSAAEFSGRVRELAERVYRYDHSALRELIPIFAPTGMWDDMGGGMDQANRVDAILTKLKWNAK